MPRLFPPTKAYASELLALTIVVLMLESCVSRTEAEPTWLRSGSYAEYSFATAFLAKGSWSDPGTYRWCCVSIADDIAVLNVTLKTSYTLRENAEGNIRETRFDVDNSTTVFVNTTTRALLDERGQAWGYAHFWIDMTKEPQSAGMQPNQRNMTLVQNYFGMTIGNATVGGAVKVGSCCTLNTPFGKFAEFVTIYAMIPQPLVISDFSTSGGILQFFYEVKSGLLVGGSYMDDVLSNRFGVVILQEATVELGRPPMELRLTGTNIDVELSKEEASLFDQVLEWVKMNAIQIAVACFTIPLLVLTLRGRKIGR